MTADQLIDLLVARLLRQHGGMKHEWRRRIGPVRLYGTDTHAHCNWAVNPAGSVAQVEAIERLVDDLRAEQPILRADR